MLEPFGVGEFASGFVGALVGVGSKIVTLGLGEVLGQAVAAVAVEVVERGAEGRNRDAQLGCGDQHFPPGILPVQNRLLELGSQQQVGQSRIFVKGMFDLAEEACSNDAAALPDPGTFAQIEAVIKQSG